MGRLPPYFILTLLTLSVTVVHGAINFEDHAFPELITSARALAMGNSFLCKTDDPWAVFYNPAGLGTVRQGSFHPGNFHFELNKGFFDVTQGDAEDTPGRVIDNFDENKLKENLERNPDNLVHSRINLFPNFTMRYFSLGYLYSRRARAALTDLSSPFELAIRQDHGPLAALNLSLFGGILKFGMSAVYLYRNELINDYDLTETVDIQKTDYGKGNMLLLTAGSRLTLPWTLLPTFAFVARNTGDRAFHPRDGNNQGAPAAIKQTYDAGFSITPVIGHSSRIHLEVNYKDLTNAYETDSKRRLAAGMEIDFARTVFFRFGSGDGFGSAGIGISTKRLIIDLTTYAVDHSETEFRGEEDRRFVLSISSGL